MTEVPGGHLCALSRPAELADALAALADALAVDGTTRAQG